MEQRVTHNYTCTLSPESLDKAQKELHEDPKTRKLETQTLRERLLRYPGLTPRTDEAFLIKFLRPGKYDQERTFELILNYYKLKKNNEEMYAEMSPKYVKHVLDAEIMCVLPHGGKMGETIVVFKSDRFDPQRIPVEDVFKTKFLLMSAIIESEEAQVHGIRFIYDLKGFSVAHVKAISISMAQKFISIFQDSFPARVKGIHHVNEHSIFDAFFAVMKPFMKDKLVQRLHFHGVKYDGLHDFVHPQHLPEEYGGEKSSLCPKDFNGHLMQKQAQFEEDAKFGFVSMTIKQESKKSKDAMETLPGTFKKLNVD